ncbi:MAG TPA: zinc-binding alcohol dehydrogenase family protein [Terriglobia bacterium]|nr:zinc-binding alcohol dehydrogenase family protein [Terriglobia bacterium]
MQQIVLEQPGHFVAAEAAPPIPQAGEALVRIRRVGVCGTDYHAFQGNQPYFNYPRILGHELSAEVASAPANDRGIKPGDRVAVEPYLNCGDCHACRAGKGNCCERLRVLGVHTDGGMQTFLAVPLDHIHKSESLSFDQLALVEPLSIGAHAVVRSGLRQGEEVLVVGAGPIGLAVTQFALAAGGRVRVLEINSARRKFAERFKVETLERFDDRLAEIVFDATGNVTSMEQSVARVAHGGRLVFVGLVQSNVAIDDPLFHRREITLLSSRNSVNEFPRIIRMIEQGQIDTAPWITHRLSLAEVPDRFPTLMRETNCIKAMVELPEGD